MIRHLFKLIWNQKRKYLGLSIEMLFSFLVLFAVFTFVVFNLQRYVEPLGFEYERVWHLELDAKGDTGRVFFETMTMVEQHLRAYPEIISVAASDANVPFSNTTNSWGLEYEDIQFSADVFRVGDDYFRTLSMEASQGRLFGPEDDGAAIPPIVLFESTAKNLFGEESGIGEIVKIWGNDEQLRVIGVVPDMRYRGDFGEMADGFFRRSTDSDWRNHLLVAVTPAANAQFEARMIQELSDLTPGWTIDQDYLTEMREDQLLFTFVPLLIFGIIGGFLIFNVALGLFGVLWQNINKRKEEIGVRRAIGSPKLGITGQFIGEMLVLATLSILAGLVFAVQFPLLQVFELAPEVYIWGMLAAVLAMYLLVGLCSLFPSWQAAQLAPALALKEE